MSNPRTITGYGKISLLLATALALLATPMVSPAMHDIATHFKGQMESDPSGRFLVSLLSFTTDTVSIRYLIKFILLSTPALMIVLCSPFMGWASDIWGRRKLLIAALFLFAFSGMSGYFASTLTELFIGRLFLGMSIAAIKTLTVAMVGDYFTGKERDRFIGWQGSAMKFGGVLFLLLGGYLADIHWRIPFWGYALAFLALPGAIFSLYDPKKPDATTPSSASKAIAPPISIPKVGFILISAFMASVLFFMTLVQIPFFIPERFAGSPGEVGFAIALANLAGAGIAVLFYRFKERLSFVTIFTLIFALMGLGYWLVSVTPNYPLLLAAMTIAGCGFGLIVPTQSAWMLSEVTGARRGFGIGLVTTAMFLGQFASPVLIEPFIDPEDPSSVFETAGIILFGLSITYAIISFFQKSKRDIAS